MKGDQNVLLCYLFMWLLQELAFFHHNGCWYKGQCDKLNDNLNDTINICLSSL